MRVLLFKGGASVEHEVSLRSAAYTSKVLKEMGQEVLEVLITKDGRFFLDESEILIRIPDGFYNESSKIEADLAFIMVHGWGGEDGKLQGLFEMLNFPYVSEDSAVSALGMRKSLQLAIFREAGLKTAPTLCIDKPVDYETAVKKLGKDIVVKPEAGGSSVGVEFLKDASPASLSKAMENAFKYDSKLLLQSLIAPMREIECGLYYDAEKDILHTLPPLEAETEEEFLSYSVKYSKPYKVGKADLSHEENNEIQELAKRAFRAAGASMYLRADFFKTADDFLINEINTIPGFTEKSHYPLMAGGDEGVKKIFKTLINNAFLRAKREKNIVRVFN